LDLNITKERNEKIFSFPFSTVIITYLGNDDTTICKYLLQMKYLKHLSTSNYYGLTSLKGLEDLPWKHLALNCSAWMLGNHQKEEEEETSRKRTKRLPREILQSISSLNSYSLRCPTN